MARGELDEDEVAELVAGSVAFEEVIEKLSPAARLGVRALVASTAETRAVFERVQGTTTDFVPIAYLDLARLAARSVGRVIFRTGGAQGTGVLVSARLLLTNNHVTESIEQAGVQCVQFNFERDILGRPAATTEFALDPERFFVTSESAQLDYTLVAVGERLGGPSMLADFGTRPLSDARDKHAEGDFVSIIQHPAGDYKQIVLRENRVLGRGLSGDTLFYGTDTLPGSSGSPVFNDQYDIVALHHAGEPTGHDTTFDDERAVPSTANEGIRTSAIVQDLLARRGKLTGEQRALLDAALTNLERDKSILPSTPRDAETPDSSIARVAPRTSFNVGPFEITARIDVRDVGAATGTIEPTHARTAADLERNRKPNTNYVVREGYDPDFLGPTLPMPVLSGALAAAAARHVGSNEMRLDYWHFSVIVHAARRLPIVTAVNIDGPTWKQINRTTRVVTDPFEAGETWYADPRLDLAHQSTQADYTIISGRFDRGHMVRREDAQWGEPSRALEAMDDTFHFTNACPQHWRFNQRAAFWQGIENYVLDGMRNAPERVTVFSGPDFADNDPIYGELKVPWTFWKIICRLHEDGSLRATGFIASQRRMINDPREALGRREWEIDPTEPIDSFQASIEEIERRTDLTFADEIRAADTHALGFENLEATSARPPTRPIADPRDANW